MKHLAAIVALLLGCQPAAAIGVCPSFTAGWSQSYSGFRITSASYDTTTLLLYVIFSSTIPTAYSNVPLSVMQGFSRTKNPDTYWSSSVNPYYHSLLLQETSNCPLLLETGAYLWSK